MMLQRLATGATGVKQARYRRRPTRGSEALARACAVYTHNASVMYVRSCCLYRIKCVLAEILFGCQKQNGGFYVAREKLLCEACKHL